MHLVAERRRLGLGTLDVAAIAHLVPEAPQTLLQAAYTDRRRAHVDAAPALAEVEGGPDDRDVPLLALTRRNRRMTPARLH